MLKYHVITSAAKMPGSVHARYRNVAIVAVADDHPDHRPVQIRDTSTTKVLMVERRLHVGKTERGAFQRAVARYERLAASMNDELQRAIAFGNDEDFLLPDPEGE